MCPAAIDGKQTLAKLIANVWCTGHWRRSRRQPIPNKRENNLKVARPAYPKDTAWNCSLRFGNLIMRAPSVILVAVLLAGCMEGGVTVERRALETVPLSGQLASGRGCSIDIPASPALVALVDVPEVYIGNNPSRTTDVMKAWANRIMALSSNAIVSEAAAGTLKRELMAVADRGALAWPSNWSTGTHRPPSVLYHTMETLFPAIVAYDQNKARFSPEEQAVFEGWVGDIVRRLGNARLIRDWRLDNKKYQYGAILAAWGYTTGDAALMRQSQAIYTTAIRGMLSDGSLPGDSERGGSALNYTNTALANLIAIAEYNRAAGIDLYSETAGGRSIHDAVSFLARARSDFSLISGYASAPDWQLGSMRPYTPTNQDLRWSTGTKALWAYYYLRRFGGTEAGQALRRALPFVAEGRVET